MDRPRFFFFVSRPDNKRVVIWTVRQSVSHRVVIRMTMMAVGWTALTRNDVSNQPLKEPQPSQVKSVKSE